jgi:hypothetical protein
MKVGGAKIGRGKKWERSKRRVFGSRFLSRVFWVAYFQYIQLNYLFYAMFRKERERKHKREKKNLCCERLFR